MQTRPCWVEIRTRSLEQNYRFLQSLAPLDAELLAIAKADAYGHSLALCAPALVRAGARFLAVTSVEEGVAARALCPEARIMVLAGIFPGQAAAVVQHHLTPVIWEPAQLNDLEAAARSTGLRASGLAVHLEIDTGMSRQGANIEGLAPLLGRFEPGSPFKIEGVMTHLYAADEADGRATQAQLANLQQALATVEAAGLYPDWLNVGGSAALLSGTGGDLAALAARHGMKAMLRPGLSLYGVTPRFDPTFESAEPPALAAARAQLQPVLSWKTAVMSVTTISPGTVVGYNGTFVATEPMRIALVAAGYADGLVRLLGNRFGLLVGGQPAPIVGRVSMDHAVLDVTEIPGVKPGDEVVILGTQGQQTITAYDHAEATGTIPWEVFTRIGARVPRIAV
ncbi:MAG TPA: alanine racemase [Terracidiphilus sp.]|nr:alanine racemase [Terracidiphilus sp.]